VIKRVFIPACPLFERPTPASSSLDTSREGTVGRREMHLNGEIKIEER